MITELSLGADDGFTLCKSIRGTPKIAYVPILIIAVAAGREQIAKAVKLRINGFLAKPFTEEALGEKVLHLLKQAGARAAPRRQKRPSGTRGKG